MFLHILTDTQQKAFLAIARQFIEADGRLSGEEQNLLELMYAESGQSFDEDLPEATVESLLPVFDSRQAQAAVLLELIGVGHADNEFHAAESAQVRKIAASFGVSDASVAEMEDWVNRQLQLAQDVEKFWKE